MMKLAPAIRPGTEIGVFSPSAPGAHLHSSRFKRGIEAIASLFGCTVRLPRDFEAEGAYTAGIAEQRAAAFLELLTDDRVGAIFTTYGGYNASDILWHLPSDTVAAHAKILVGYSDTTALLLGYQAMAGVVTYYGPAVLPQFGEYPEPFAYTLQELEKVVVRGEGGVVEVPPFWTDNVADWTDIHAERSYVHRDHDMFEVWRSGRGVGSLFGGNVATVNHLMGTPYFAPPSGDLVLFVEATADEAKLPAFHRSLAQLRNAGLFARTSALLVGRCPDSVPVGSVGLRQMVLEVTRTFTFPVIAQLPFGHTDPMTTLPIGCVARVTADGVEPHIEVLGPTAMTSSGDDS